MSDLSNYAENAIVNHLLRNTALTSPTTVYLALFTAVSDAEAGTGTEVVAAGYARQPVAFDAPSNGATQNTAVEDFGPLSGSGTATHAALFDAVSGGNALTVIKALAAPKTWADGDTIRFAAGDVDFSLA
jgi:hypothetical protein